MPGMQAATPALAHSPLEPQLQKAGATMVPATAGGSPRTSARPAGELALCETAVGLADRSDLGKLELRGLPGAIVPLVGQLTGGQVDPGDALLAEGAWWCAVSPAHVLALCDAGETERVRAAAAEAVRWTPGATVTDVTPRYAALGLLGPRTADVLTELSDSEPPLGDVDSPAFDVLRLAAIPAMLLRGAPGSAVIAHRGGARRGAVDRGRARRPRGGHRPRRRRRGVPPLPARALMSEAPRTPSEAIAPVKVHAPSERNRKLAAFLAACNGDTQLKARWLAQQTTAERLGMSDHSWVHLQIVLNMALRLFRMLRKHGVKSAIERDYAMNPSDAEVIIAGACLLHDLGMSIHRVDHEAFSLFLAADSLDRACSTGLRGARAHDRLVGDPARDHRPPQRRAPAHARGRDRARGRRARHGARPLRAPETHLPNIHSLSAAAIDEVRLVEGESRPIRIEVEMNNSAGVFQVGYCWGASSADRVWRSTSRSWRASRPNTRSD